MLGLGREFTVLSAEDPDHRDPYDAPHLARNAANFTALTPLSFLSRAVAVYPDKLAVVHGANRAQSR